MRTNNYCNCYECGCCESPAKEYQIEPLFSGAFIVDDEYVYIKKVIYNDPYTIVLWSDGKKTTSRRLDEDKFNKELGLSLAVLKKLAGHDQVAKLLDDWAPEKANVIDLKMIRAKEKLSKKIEEKKAEAQKITEAKEEKKKSQPISKNMTTTTTTIEELK